MYLLYIYVVKINMLIALRYRHTVLRTNLLTVPFLLPGLCEVARRRCGGSLAIQAKKGQ